MRRSTATREPASASRVGTLARWTRTLADPVPSRVRSALLLGAWLSLTGLFAAGGAVLAVAVAAATGRSAALVTVATTVVGVFGSLAVAPTLARVVLLTVLERAGALADRHREAPAAGWRGEACIGRPRTDCVPPCCD